VRTRVVFTALCEIDVQRQQVRHRDTHADNKWRTQKHQVLDDYLSYEQVKHYDNELDNVDVHRKWGVSEKKRNKMCENISANERDQLERMW
jgi:hypothetical protein